MTCDDVSDISRLYIPAGSAGLNPTSFAVAPQFSITMFMLSSPSFSSRFAQDALSKANNSVNFRPLEKKIAFKKFRAFKSRFSKAKNKKMCEYCCCVLCCHRSSMRQPLLPNLFSDRTMLSMLEPEIPSEMTSAS